MLKTYKQLDFLNDANRVACLEAYTNNMEFIKWLRTDAQSKRKKKNLFYKFNSNF